VSTKNILCIDDEPDVITHLTALFEDNGYATCTATDGEEGMQAVNSEKPDLITLDLVMPNETGVKFLRKIKKNDTLKNIPVIIVSGLQDFRTFIQKCGPVPDPEGFIDKPIDETLLLEKVKELVG
jgi:CheY-like chemotaxis protein